MGVTGLCLDGVVAGVTGLRLPAGVKALFGAGFTFSLLFGALFGRGDTRFNRGLVIKFEPGTETSRI